MKYKQNYDKHCIASPPSRFQSTTHFLFHIGPCLIYGSLIYLVCIGIYMSLLIT